jgi:hypothetical protein
MKEDRFPKKGGFDMSDQGCCQEGAKQVDDPEVTRKKQLTKKLDAVGWGLFFIWIGIAFLADVGIGVALLGVGIIVLGEQVVRRYFSLKLEWFWLVVGLLLLAGGLWELLKLELPLVPLLLIIVGLVWLISAIWGKGSSEKPPH